MRLLGHLLGLQLTTHPLCLLSLCLFLLSRYILPSQYSPRRQAIVRSAESNTSRTKSLLSAVQKNSLCLHPGRETSDPRSIGLLEHRRVGRVLPGRQALGIQISQTFYSPHNRRDTNTHTALERIRHIKFCSEMGR